VITPVPLASLLLAAGGAGLAAAGLLSLAIHRWPDGTPAMRDIAALIRTGALAFLRREYIVLGPFVLAVALLLYWAIGWRTAAAYVGGGLCSVLAGLFGMNAATRANVRTAEAARVDGQALALRVAFSGGAVMGLAVASLGVLGIGVVLGLFYDAGFAQSSWRALGETISGFAMGASSVALFARVGGGIYTKAADVGADPSARSRPESPRTIRATPPPSPITSGTTSATSPAWAPTSSRATSAR
jgi:K(+)-stimulated pyrophosphate-energized sodium pump